MVMTAASVVGHRCAHGHPLYYVARSMLPPDYSEKKVTVVLCDNCRIYMRYQDDVTVMEPFVHCPPCGYDLCLQCYSADAVLFDALTGTRANQLLKLPSDTQHMITQRVRPILHYTGDILGVPAAERHAPFAYMGPPVEGHAPRAYKSLEDCGWMNPAGDGVEARRRPEEFVRR